MLLLIDNFDSFAHNLARYLERLGQPTHVVRNDALRLEEIDRWQPRAIVLSPGPCTPQEAGCCLEVVRRYHQTIPLLGVCLGHQTIAAALGGKIIRAAGPMHGRTSQIEHDCQDVFAGLPSPLEVCRYHSLVVEDASLPSCLAVKARSEDGTIMALQHRALPVVGVQFHPESILSSSGYPLLANFLRLAEIEATAADGLWAGEYRPQEDIRGDVLPQRPVTF